MYPSRRDAYRLRGRRKQRRRETSSAVLSSALSVLLLSAALSVPTLASESVLAVQQGRTTAGEKIKLFQHAAVSLSEAIAAAKNHGAGQLVEVSFEISNGKPVYNVKTYQNNEVWKAAIDAQSGRLVGNGTIVAEDQLDEEDKAEVASLRQASVTLAEAVDTAEKSLGGRAISAELEEANGKVMYEITVVLMGGFAKPAAVDPKTGQLGG
jgi:uncharacterized membrane protein YkoI